MVINFNEFYVINMNVMLVRRESDFVAPGIIE